MHTWLTEAGPCLDPSHVYAGGSDCRVAQSIPDSAPGVQRMPKLGRIQPLFLLFFPLGCTSSPTPATADRMGMAEGGRRGGGGKRMAVISVGTISKPQECLWHVRTACVCLFASLEGGTLLTLTQPRNYLWEIIIKEYLVDIVLAWSPRELGH